MRSLSARLLGLFTIALLPLGLIAVFQTLKVVNEAEAIAENEILAKTVQAARAEIGLIRRAHGVAYALGTAAAATETNPAQCSAIMARFVQQDPQFAFAGFIPLDGLMKCSSTGEPMDFSGFDDWKDFVQHPRRMVTFNREGAATGGSVTIASAPIFSEAGALVGAGSVSIPHSLAEEYLENDVQNLEVAIVNELGDILSASTGGDRTDAFRSLNLVPGDMDIPGSGITMRMGTDAEPLAVALVPLIKGESYLVGRWTDTSQPFSVSLLGTATPVFPVIMWLMSLFVAFFAIDRLVLQYLKKLRRRMAAFSPDDLSGSYVHLQNAPREITEIASSYNQMIDRITKDREDLAKGIQEKDILLKEIHHRVKNNLQLIASILNMQLRQIDVPEAKSVLRRVQDRVMSLATIHKSLYTDTNVDKVRIDRLLTEIIGATMNVGATPGQGMQTEMTLAPVELNPDQAVPLSLLVTEAVTNALKYVGGGEVQSPTLSVSLTEPEPSVVHLDIENSRGVSAVDPSEGTGLGARLIEAFVQQLGGDLDVVDTASTYALHVRFTKLDHHNKSAEAA